MRIAKSLQNIQPSYIREILKAANQPGVISLAGGLPAPERFPMQLMTSALLALPSQSALFQYANTIGYAPLIEYLTDLYRLPTNHSGLVCTGSQQALDLIARAFINPGDNILLEAPSYLGALQVFGLAQANIHSIQQNNEGPDLEQLAALFASKKITMFYVVPDFHNPTGVCWSLNTRQKVAKLCQQYNVALIEDIPYRELRFNGQSLPLVSSFCPEHSLALRSFSKIATPGIRLGWVSGRNDWLHSLIKIKQAADLHSSVPMQAVLLALLQHSDFQAHLTQTKALYKSRFQCLSDNLRQSLPPEYYTNPIAGGMFIWLHMPKCNVDDIAQSALNNGVAVVPSSAFYQKHTTISPALRLNFTHANETQLVQATKRLQEILIA